MQQLNMYIMNNQLVVFDVDIGTRYYSRQDLGRIVEQADQLRQICFVCCVVAELGTRSDFRGTVGTGKMNLLILLSTEAEFLKLRSRAKK